MCAGSAAAAAAGIDSESAVPGSDSNALLKRLLENAAKSSAAAEAGDPSVERSYKLATITPEQQRQLNTVIQSTYPPRSTIPLSLPTVGQPPVHQRPTQTLSTVPRMTMPHTAVPRLGMPHSALPRPALLQTTVMRPGIPHSASIPRAGLPPYHEDPYPWNSQLGISPESWAAIPPRDRQQIYGANFQHNSYL